MIWIKILKMIFIFMCGCIGWRAGGSLFEKFSTLKWYDKVCRILWYAAVGIGAICCIIALWRAL